MKAEKARRAIEEERDRIARDAERIRNHCVSLAGFVKEAWRVIEPDTTLVWNWHLDAICEHLEAITAGRINRLLVNVPPGSSKSLLASVLWQAWEWGPCGRPSLRYLATAFNDGPVKRDTRKCRDLIMSDWYQSLWPAVRLTRTGETSFANSSTGSREGVAFGSLTSQRGDRLIIDDPHSTRTAESETDRERTTRQFREGALNRLNDQARSAIVVIMQRLHERDISGVILDLKMDYTHLCLPMEFEPSRRCATSIGFRDPRSGEGELLDPGRFGADTVAAMKRETTAFAWAGQYQQRPAPREGALFKRHWFEVVEAAPASGTVCRGWDLAATNSSTSDWTAGVRMRRTSQGVFYIEDVRRDRLDGLKVEQMIKNTATSDGMGVHVSLPQDPGQAGKVQVASLIRLLAGHLVKSSLESGDKETRATPFANQCEAGNVKILRGDWNEAFLDEITTFPAGAHDDQVDAATRAFNFLAEKRAPMIISDDIIRKVAASGSRW